MTIDPLLFSNEWWWYPPLSYGSILSSLTIVANVTCAPLYFGILWSSQLWQHPL